MLSVYAPRPPLQSTLFSTCMCLRLTEQSHDRVWTDFHASHPSFYGNNSAAFTRASLCPDYALLPAVSFDHPK